MGDKIYHFLMKRPVQIAVLVIVVLGLTGAGWGIYQTQTPPEQPIQFPHKVHVGLGIQCLYCHPGALRGPSPGLPTITKCWGCHQQLAKYADGSVPLPQDLQILKDHVDKNEPVKWVPVALVPDFVHFTHRPHIAAGLNCEQCHGEVSQMTVYQNPQVMNMGWCLNCHRKKAANDPVLLTKLTDCGTCHY
jgi:hypothetical protein